MKFLNLFKNIFLKDKKVLIVGLDNSGKSTFVSFLKYGTFVEHPPTMGKDQSTIEIQGLRINLIDMGGQKDFRSLWLGECSDSQCVIFMLDGNNKDRFNEAKKELWKLTTIIKKTPLIILANKYDLEPNATIGEIIDYFELAKLPSFEILSISCKTGYGIVNAFSKIYYKLTGKQLTKRSTPKMLTIFDNGGVPIATREGDFCNEDILRGGLFTAITNFIKESFNSELTQLKLEGHIIILKKSQNFMGSLVLEDSDLLDLKEAEYGLSELLNHLEHIFTKVEKTEVINPEKIEILVKQYSTNLFN
ncbi:MAG: ADP-ribosylation factor-like protein [Promethearchaeota archaeon]